MLSQDIPQATPIHQPLVLQWYYYHVTVVLRYCYCSVTEVLRWYYGGVTECYGDVTVVLL
jgi:hypothetical protein